MGDLDLDGFDFSLLDDVISVDLEYKPEEEFVETKKVKSRKVYPRKTEAKKRKVIRQVDNAFFCDCCKNTFKNIYTKKLHDILKREHLLLMVLII